MSRRNKLVAAVFLICLYTNSIVYAEELNTEVTKYPDYAFEYLGNDKYENFNRKMFAFNLKLNKYAIKPVHTIWACVMPKYGMDRIKGVSTNIEYPKKLISSLIQKDFDATKKETARFFINTTVGLGGMYDPAKSLFHIEPTNEDMEQALAKCNCKSGPYLVIPVLSSSTPRGLGGKALDAALNPSSYVVFPILALVKAGLLVNRTSYMQPIAKMVESTYADPYDIARKLYGIQNYIHCANLDRKEVLQTKMEMYNDAELVDSFNENLMPENDNEIIAADKETPKGETTEVKASAETETIKGSAQKDNVLLRSKNHSDANVYADMMLFDYNPQTPVIDAMRTALFELPGVTDSIWSELSVWNRCFSKRIHTASVSIDPERENYRYRYIMQKDKSSPVAIIYPSIGEGITSHHSDVIAKIFYDQGYSVIIQGSHFQWEFVKSMPADYRPGIPSQDADYLKIVTSKIMNNLQAKYNCQFPEKVVIGTSFGALAALYLADKEYHNNTMNITKYISINPPVELMYAMKQVDKNTAEWNKNPDNLKERVAVTTAKIIQISQMVNEADRKIETLPFSDEEAKLITGFIMHQKLSDLIFTIENTAKNKSTGIYKTINNMTYEDYARKYLMAKEDDSIDDLQAKTSLLSLADYLQHNNNYKIYHSLDDYLVSREQLKALKEYSGANTVIMSNGSHLGFLYRPEFIESLKKDIAINTLTQKSELLTMDK